MPPYLVFEFPELVFAVFKGGKQQTSVNVTLASIKERGNFLQEPPEHMRDHTQIPKPCPLRPRLQHLGLPSFLFRMERLEEEPRLTHHVFSLLAVCLLVVAEEVGHLPRGARHLGEIF